MTPTPRPRTEPTTADRDPGRPSHVVLGAGPVGAAVAERWVAAGHRVRIVSRSGSGPDGAGITRTAADAADPAALRAALDGAEVVVNALNPPYHRWAQEWPALHHAVLDAAAAAGASLILVDNLYAYGDTGGRPLSPDLPQAATGPKGRVRATMADELLAAHRDGRLRAAVVRASDYVGPRVRQSSFGERVVPRVLAGRKVALLGALDVPHAVTFVPDLATTVDAIARAEQAWGRIWHVPSAPACTQRQLVERMAALAGTKVAVSTVPRLGLALAGMFSPTVRELAEVRYQFTGPWLVDASATERELGVTATPLDDALRATLDWYRTAVHPR